MMASRLQLLLLACAAVPIRAVRDEAADSATLASAGAGPEGPSSLAAANSSQRVWHCTDACVECDDGHGSDGISWRIGRSQPTGRKIAKAFTFGAVAAVVALTGGLAGAVGGVVMGGVAFFGGGTTLMLAGGGIGMAHLLSNQNDRACPLLTFEEKLPKNSGFWAGMKADFQDAWNTIRKQDRSEQSFSLADLNYQEILLRLKKNGKPSLQGERQNMDAEMRLNMALACNVLTFDKKEWLGESRKAQSLSDDEAEEAIIKQCGQWLCAGKGVSKAFELGTFSKCGGRTHVLKNIFR